MEMEVKEDEFSMDPINTDTALVLGNDVFDPSKDNNVKALINPKMYKTLIKPQSNQVDFIDVHDDPNARTFICPYCAFSFAYKHVLERHVKQIHEKHLLPTLECPKCTYTTVRKDQMRSHFSVVHEDFKPFYCSECNFRAPKAFRVQTHIQKNHGGSGAVIHDASLKPRSVSPPAQNLTEGSITDDQASEDSLDIPSGSTRRTYSQKTIRHIPRILNRSRHQEAEEEEDTHALVVPFYCPYCDFNSDSQIEIGDHVVLNHVAEHIQRNAQPPPDPKECNLCLVQVTSARMLERHVRSEHPDVLVV